jgi:hypothetical protein
MRARALVVVFGIAVAETLHGIARTLWLTPRLGDLRARQLGVVTGSMLIVAIATVAIRWLGPRTPHDKLAIGALWLVCMLAFEIGLGRALGVSWTRLAADYDPRQGGVMLLGMTVLLFAPTIACRIRDPFPPRF